MRFQSVAAVLLISASNPGKPMIQSAGHHPRIGDQGFASLDSLRDCCRPLLVFAPTRQDERFLKQAAQLAGAGAQLSDRQVVLVPLSYEPKAAASGTLPKGLQTAEFSPGEAWNARRRFAIDPKEFTVILIGKDGGEKLRTHTPVTMERLNAVIDAMPMRRQEIRDGHSN